MNSKRKSRKLLILALILPAFALACQAVLPLSSSPTQVESPPSAVQVPTPLVVTVPSNVANEQDLLVNLYARANPSVVNITIYSDQTSGLIFPVPTPGDQGNPNGQVIPVSQGSGFVYDNNGHIVTNAHVVNGAKQIDVTFSDGTVRSADIVGQDLNSDLAVVKVDSMPSDAAPLPLGDMTKLAVGQTVVAIGNPFGLEGTLTRGIISGLGRTIPALTQFSIPEAIQTDAAINPGNSGGPLLNLQGEVVGVNAQIETNGTSNSNLGVGFAIPINILQLVVPDLIQNGSHPWAWLGVRGSSLIPEEVQAMKLPVDKGAYLVDIISGGPADKAGLQGVSGTDTVNGRQVDVGGDVVTAIDGQPINSFDDLLIYVALHTSPGQEVTLTILRNGQKQDVKVKLEPRPATIPNQ
jgi:S1-C subfamily serine protease